VYGHEQVWGQIIHITIERAMTYEFPVPSSLSSEEVLFRDDNDLYEAFEDRWDRTCISESPVPPSLSSNEEVSHRYDDFEGRWDRTCIFVFLHDNIHVVCVSSAGTMRK
jgi:hypothetical protein